MFQCIQRTTISCAHLPSSSFFFVFAIFFNKKKKKKEVPEIKYLLDLNVVQQMHHTEDPLLKMWIAPEEGCHKIKGR